MANRTFTPHFLLNFFRHPAPIAHPAIHPRLLWIISSNSNNPRHRINCNPSMHPEIKIPNSKPCHHLILPLLPNTNGSNIPAGNNITIFNRFSRKSPVPSALPKASFAAKLAAAVCGRMPRPFSKARSAGPYTFSRKPGRLMLRATRASLTMSTPMPMIIRRSPSFPFHTAL